MYERCKKDFFFVCYLFFLFLFYPSFFLCSSILFSSLPNFFFLLSSYRYYFFVSWTKVPREPDEKIVRSPKLLVFLNNVRRDIICYIYFTLRGDFRLFIFLLRTFLFFLLFVRFLLLHRRTPEVWIDPFVHGQCTPSYANESHSFVLFSTILYIFPSFSTRFEISSSSFHPFLFSSWSYVRRSPRIRDRLVKRNVREAGGSWVAPVAIFLPYDDEVTMFKDRSSLPLGLVARNLYTCMLVCVYNASVCTDINLEREAFSFFAGRKPIDPSLLASSVFQTLAKQTYRIVYNHGNINAFVNHVRELRIREIIF